MSRELVQKGSPRGIKIRKITKIFGPAKRTAKRFGFSRDPERPMMNHGKATVEKGTTEKASTRIVSGRQTSSVAAHSLRAALGLASTSEQDDQTAKSMREYQKREQRRRQEPQAEFGNIPSNIPGAVQPGGKPPETVPQVSPSTLSAVAEAIRTLHRQAGGDHPILLDLGEISDMTGLAGDTVNTAIMRLERNGTIQSHGTGSLGVRRFEPA